MRKVIFILFLGAAGFVSSDASARDYPYCLQGRDWGYPGLCDFTTYGQCAATASGTFSYCGINPRFAFAQQRQYGRRGGPWW